MRRRPKRSPSAAPVGRRTAKLRLEAFTVYSSASIEVPRSTRVALKAAATTIASSIAMSEVIDVSARTHVFLAFSLGSFMVFGLTMHS
jgi:hypothetical protein